MHILPNDIFVFENGEELHILVLYGHFKQSEYNIILTWANTRLHPYLMTIIPFTFFTRMNLHSSSTEISSSWMDGHYSI